jgi:hypothetical protein
MNSNLPSRLEIMYEISPAILAELIVDFFEANNSMVKRVITYRHFLSRNHQKRIKNNSQIENVAMLIGGSIGLVGIVALILWQKQFWKYKPKV